MQYNSIRDGIKGFTLVELSIVLVIIGLVVGGILTGRALIHSAEIRSVSSDFVSYYTAIIRFKDVYSAYPGDMPNAYDFFGSTMNCTNVLTDVDWNGCNGNGDGQISNGNERLRTFNHLEAAGMIKGHYVGNIWGATPGVSVPAAAINGAGFLMRNIGLYKSASAALAVPAIEMGKCGYYCNAPALSSEDAMLIDKKIDDGEPSTGKFQAAGTVGLCTDVAWNAYAVAHYVFSTTIDCNVIYLVGP